MVSTRRIRRDRSKDRRNYLWPGRQSTPEEKKAAMSLGEKFIKDQNLPRHTALTRIRQGGEPQEFRCLFKEWVV